MKKFKIQNFCYDTILLIKLISKKKLKFTLKNILINK